MVLVVSGIGSQVTADGNLYSVYITYSEEGKPYELGKMLRADLLTSQATVFSFMPSDRPGSAAIQLLGMQTNVKNGHIIYGGSANYLVDDSLETFNIEINWTESDKKFGFF